MRTFLLTLLLCISVAHAEEPMTFSNPLKVHGADPWLTWHDGFYYLTTTTGRNIEMRKAPTLAALKGARDVEVWKDTHPDRSDSIWATEFHRLTRDDGETRWYGYYTAARRGDEPSHRMYVIESAGDDPMGPYHFKAQLHTDRDNAHYAIDGSPFRAADGQLYFTWCGRPSPHGQGLFISRMTDPWTLEGDRVVLEADGFGCKYVREGPVALQRNGRIFLVYSMCAADTPDYRLGMLIADDNADLCDPAAWTQHPEVIFQRHNEVGVYGPGHNFFFRSPDGSEDWIVYHGKTTLNSTYGDRTTRAQRFTWNPDGTPALGDPVNPDQPLPEPAGTPTTQPANQPAAR